jgi:hypothetical protein
VSPDEPNPQYLQFDITSIRVDVIADEEGRPALVIRSGNVTVELSGGAHIQDAVVGARRITEKIWDYILAVEAQRHNGAVDPPSGLAGSGDRPVPQQP